MQTEIDAEQTLRPVHILGLNDIGLESGNESMTAGQHLSWLQPGVGQNIWIDWQVGYRDVIILGPKNEHIDTFNLSTYNLAEAENYAALRDLLLATANE